MKVKDGLSCDDASLHEDFEEDGFRIVNSEKDFLALLSSTPGQLITNVFRCYHDYDLLYVIKA